MENTRDSDPRPMCPECKAPLVLCDAYDGHYHWLCTVRDCAGRLLTPQNKPLALDAIARDMADKQSVIGLFATSNDRRKDQATFRRAASTLNSDHRLFRYLSDGDREAIQTASAALRRLARATETAKEIMARREAQEKKEHELQARIDNEQAFQQIVAQSFDRDTVLLRCEALADFVDSEAIYGGGDVRAWLATFRRTPDERRWTQLVQRTGVLLNEEMFAGQWPHDFESYWREWKAGRRYRAALSEAQARGNPDA